MIPMVGVRIVLGQSRLPSGKPYGSEPLSGFPNRLSEICPDTTEGTVCTMWLGLDSSPGNPEGTVCCLWPGVSVSLWKPLRFGTPLWVPGPVSENSHFADVPVHVRHHGIPFCRRSVTIVTPAVHRPSRLNSIHGLGWHNRAPKKVCPVGFLDLENPPGSPVLGFPLGRAGDGFVACIAFGIHRHHGFRLRQSRVYRDRRWH